MQPESSDGFASVGTILPKERAALLPGGFFRFCLVTPESSGESFLRALFQHAARFDLLRRAPQFGFVTDFPRLATF
jgi:hypothetical protein